MPRVSLKEIAGRKLELFAYIRIVFEHWPIARQSTRERIMSIVVHG